MALLSVLSHVALHVKHQRVLVDERLAAELALVLHGLEVRIVDHQMLHQSVIVRERLVTVMADVFLGVVLRVHVAVQLGVAEESFLTNLAVPGVLVEMASLVGGQLEGLHERVAANVADEIPLPRVDLPVHCQRAGPFEVFPADVALEGAGVAVRNQMVLVEVLRPEKLATGFTLVIRLRRRLLIRRRRILSGNRLTCFVLVQRIFGSSRG